jgi:Popeye protein conserved region.
MPLTPRNNLRIHKYGHIKSLTLILIIHTAQVNVMSDHQFLHPIMPCEFLDSPEFESSRATTDDKFKVRNNFYAYFTENNV